MAAKSILQHLIKDIEDKKYCQRLLLNKESDELTSTQETDFRHKIETERAANKALKIMGHDDSRQYLQQDDFTTKCLQSLEHLFVRDPSLISLLKLVASENSGAHCESQQQFLNAIKDTENV